MSLASKIKSHWRLDEDESGGVGKDAASTYDLTDRNTVTSGTGKIGKCIFATASSQENLYYLDDDYWNLQDGFGFSLWFRTEGWFDSNVRRLMCKRDQYDIFRTSGSYGSPDLKIKITAAGGSNFTETLLSGLSASTWYWLYWGVDGSNLRYSVNGESLQTGGAITSYGNYGYAWELGNWSGTGMTGRFWNGEIDEGSYWSSILSDSEIETLYASGSGISYPHEAGGGGGGAISRAKNDIAISIRV